MARLPKSIIKKYGISKKAWAVFRGRRGRRASSNPKPRRRKFSLARRRRYSPRRWLRRRRSSKATVPLAPIIGLVATPAVSGAIDKAMKGDWVQVVKFLKNLVGVTDQGFDTGVLIQNATPIVAGLLVHKFIGGRPLNFNAALARARVPYLRI